MHRLLIFTMLSLIFIAQASAQLSPGDLHDSHTQLEGITQCIKCHELGDKVSPELCLQCHDILKKRVDAGKGLHSNAEFKSCVHCHVDHQGRKFKLVFWKNGKESFEHGKTGYDLLGKHKNAKCEDCHQAKNIADKKRFIEKKKDLNRTFLGLEEDCLSCHFDEHRAQFNQPCLDCHTMNHWAPAEKFDHQKTRYKLTGKHRNVACVNCHPVVRDSKNKIDRDYFKFAGIQYDKCTACHKDVHNNKFGQDCESCHTTASWKKIIGNKFNHDQTRYPLRGQHAKVRCEQCHLPNRAFTNVKFANCTDCHTDYHLGQFRQRDRRGACEECHTVQGFSPSGFTIKLHQQSKFQLTGSHLAIPCIACHTKVRVRGKSETIRFKFKSTQCSQCHDDFHKGELNKYVSQAGCEFCHSTEDWAAVSFDHNKTKFVLKGQHEVIACGDCHRPTKNRKIQSKLKLVGLVKECQGCHRDVHAGQFRNEKIFAKIKKNFTRCDQCHTSENWRADKFIHNRDARFKIDGEHRFVTCGECHKRRNIRGKLVVIYKPIDSECRACHDQNPKKLKQKNE
ncbi:MAG: cytochrome C [Calditrichaeota bacterium]|nr:MAG: cytochrome C [Calditrichota bacterium]